MKTIACNMSWTYLKTSYMMCMCMWGNMIQGKSLKCHNMTGLALTCLDGGQTEKREVTINWIKMNLKIIMRPILIYNGFESIRETKREKRKKTKKRFKCTKGSFLYFAEKVFTAKSFTLPIPDVYGELAASLVCNGCSFKSRSTPLRQNVYKIKCTPTLMSKALQVHLKAIASGRGPHSYDCILSHYKPTQIRHLWDDVPKI